MKSSITIVLSSPRQDEYASGDEYSDGDEFSSDDNFEDGGGFEEDSGDYAMEEAGDKTVFTGHVNFLALKSLES